MASKKYRVMRGFGCPDPRSIKTVLRAKGMSRLTDEERESVSFVEFKIGDEYKGAPRELRAGHIAKGLVELVPVKSSNEKGAK